MKNLAWHFYNCMCEQLGDLSDIFYILTCKILATSWQDLQIRLFKVKIHDISFGLQGRLGFSIKLGSICSRTFPMFANASSWSAGELTSLNAMLRWSREWNQPIVIWYFPGQSSKRHQISQSVEFRNNRIIWKGSLTLSSTTKAQMFYKRILHHVISLENR